MLSTFYRDAELLIDFTIQQMEQEQPCVVVCDQFAIWGRGAARYCGVPVCKFFSSILADEIVYETDPYFKNAIAYMILTPVSYTHLQETQKLSAVAECRMLLLSRERIIYEPPESMKNMLEEE